MVDSDSEGRRPGEGEVRALLFMEPRSREEIKIVTVIIYLGTTLCAVTHKDLPGTWYKL